ncbi:MAG: hypothetical protein LW715_03025 [Rhodobacter sp.]|jgi:hypothetical protein|nr:hypothetical protein [Rhodobacter sp.]
MPEWTHPPGLSPCDETLAAMVPRVAAIAAGTGPEAGWLRDHPATITAIPARVFAGPGPLAGHRTSAFGHGLIADRKKTIYVQIERRLC